LTTIGAVRLPFSASKAIVLLEADVVTVRLKVVVLVIPPPVPVTVTAKVPVGVEEEVAMFKLREQVGLQDVEELYEAVAPLGTPDVLKETD
jgi:hypothetical protein